MLRSLLALLCLFPAVTAAGQGFSMFNARNHPELDWQVAETPHFRIMYPAHLAGIEAEAAPIAEASYEALSANLGVTFDEKIRIYLSDEDEIINGFAVPLGAGYTAIWVHQGDPAGTWTGREKWLRKVVAHELAHIFHYRAVRSPIHPFDNVLADPLPRFWTEGLAQYQTETWDAQRGDRWLRTAVLDDRLNYDDGRSIWNGRLLYAVGNAQVRYFAEQYGDSTLARLLAHRKPALLGLTRVHDFEAAFKAVAGKPYRDFYDEWRRDVNVYYNTLAGQMETTDSLGTDPLALPGQYLYDVRYAPDTSRVAVVALTSLRRPVRRLYVREAGRPARVVAEGAIQAPVTWSPDGTRLAFARTARGEHGSLLHDLYLVGADGDGLRRLTRSRRAASPAFAPEGGRLAFVATTDGTSNLFVLDLDTGAETRLTDYTGDVRLSAPRWHPGGARIAFSRFAPDGTRDVVVLDLGTGRPTSVTDGAHDDRGPIWSPDGTHLAYTSLRDRVPNVFVRDLATGAERRVTYLVTGAEVHDWLPPDSAHAAGTLIVLSNVEKSRDRAYRVDAARTAPALSPSPPEGYAAWTIHRPPHEVAPALPPDPSFITDRYAYSSWRNLTHGSSLALPYYAGPDAWGLFGFTGWVEPLSKHLLFAVGGLSLGRLEDSFFLGSYVNNTWHPSLAFSAYRLPGSARAYGNDFLVETFTGGEVDVSWPLDGPDLPFVSTFLSARVRYVDITPLDGDDFEAPEGLAPPQAGQQADLRLSYTLRRQRPYADNAIHPLDGYGLRLQLTGAAPLLGADSRFFRADAAAFGVFPALGLHRFYLYGRGQVQTGTPFAQDVLGLSRHDDVQIGLPGTGAFTLGESERVRGYRRYALGTRLLFGSAEYRMPFLPDLQTRILGIISLGGTSLAAFADGALVWTGNDLEGAVRRLGVGLEVKNALRLGGALELAHAVGFAQPASDLGSRDDYEVYYRIRAALPF